MFKPPELKDVRRENRTEDIVVRRGVITADRVHLKKYPVDNPVTIFNASLFVEHDDIVIYGRIVLGYFTYASAVAEFMFPVKELYNNLFSGHYTAEITVFPDNRFDLWGVEDPRVYEIDGRRLMTYCGRTVNYFDPSVRVERTLPVTAIYDGGKWRKLCVFRMPEEYRGFVISDKDAFLVKMGNELKLFHRIHMKDENFYLVMSNVNEDVLNFDKFTEVSVQDTTLVLEPAKFEDKLGWSTPPVKVDGEHVLLLHAVDAETKSYRVLAILMDDSGKVTAITPCYIMGPKESYEVYGDRPFTVFPCGAQLIDDKLIISYGAADSAIGIGEIDVSELMSILDSNRIG
ncbi:glycoside hydrolase family 130 protein [Archaeoglobus veneficus]|uniref:Glycosidase related protein n=1 Tax=Archaeoglobus veneficus (strain DSM 11195 / SNP6) TaxID=693661 RepID=F2KP09_ARCVS|nr:glycosidase [Archaeoglobus veneficus]AEA46317.1 glycosidase related protein [Archaeoglobus veneficus SNP6]